LDAALTDPTACPHCAAAGDAGGRELRQAI